MSTHGGSANTAGVSYETWYTAFWFAKAYLVNTLVVEPQKKFHLLISSNFDQLSSESSQIQDVEETEIDDLVVSNGDQRTYFNLKRKAPNHKGIWSFSELVRSKVLDDLKSQYLKDAKANLVFVSEDKADYIHQDEVFGAKDCSCRVEVEEYLTPDRLKKWDQLKEYFNWNDTELLDFARQVEMRQKPQSELRSDIMDKLQGTIDRPELVPAELCVLALEAAKFKKKITQEEIIQHLRVNNIFPTSLLAPEDLKRSMLLSSQELLSRPSTLGNSKLHIKRDETSKILSWMDKSNGKPILILVGKAGSGKTTILRETLEIIKNQDIPVLGLKADVLAYNSTQELEDELKIGEEIEKAVATVIQKFGKLVVLIDQIDALSLSFSAKRKPLNVYLRLIDRLSQYQKIKLIVSCRDFDLNYDEQLKKYNLNNQSIKIEVGDLSDSQVEGALKELGVSYSLSPKLLVLLKTPSNLNVFSQIIDPNEKFHEISTLQNLYEVFVKKRIEEKGKSAGIKVKKVYALLGKIASKMHKDQKIALARVKFVNKYSDELLFLETQGIVVRASSRIQFFHQSFFDFIFARNLLIKEKALYQIITHEHQGLFIRSMIRQVLSYLRGTDSEIYHKELGQLLWDPDAQNVRIHLKDLILKHIADEESPTNGEINIIAEISSKNPELFSLFLEASISAQWVEILEKNQSVIDYIHDDRDSQLTGRVFFKHTLVEAPNSSLKILSRLKVQNKEEYVIDKLFFLQDWSYPDSIKIFENYRTSAENSYSYQTCLKRIAQYHPVYFCQIIREKVEGKFKIEVPRGSGDFFLNDSELKGFQKLFHHHPLIAFELGIDLIKDYERVYIPVHNDVIVLELEKTLGLEKDAIDPNKYFSIPFFPPNSLALDSSSEVKFYRMMESNLNCINKDRSENSIQLFSKLINSNCTALIQLAFQAIVENPIQLKHYGFELLTRQGLYLDKHLRGDFDYWLKETLRIVYPHLSLTEQGKLNDLILGIKTPLEDLKWEENGEKKHGLKWNGLERFNIISAIPLEWRRSYPKIKKTYLEGKRKFGEIKNEKPKGIVISGIPPLISKESLEKMNDAKLIKTLEGLEAADFSLAHLLSGLVQSNPNKYLPLFRKMVPNQHISEGFIAQALDGIIRSDIEREIVQPLYFEFLLRFERSDESSKKTIIWAFRNVVRDSPITKDLFDFLSKVISGEDSPKSIVRETTPIVDDYSSKGKGNDALNVIGNLLSKAASNVRGAALRALLLVNVSPTLEDEVFSLMNEVVNDNSLEIRVLLSYNIAHLTRLNPDRTIELFSKLMEEKNPFVLSSCGFSLPYLMNHSFSKLNHFFMDAMNVEMMHHNLGRSLVIACWREYTGARDLLEIALKKGSRIICGALSMCFDDFAHENDKARKFNISMAIGLLDHPGTEVQRMITDSFRRFKSEDYLKIREFVMAFVKTLEGRDHLDGFYQFILGCAEMNPTDSINILENFPLHQNENHSNNWFQDKPLQALITAYSSLGEKKGLLAKKAMDVMDKMILNREYRLVIETRLENLTEEYHNI